MSSQIIIKNSDQHYLKTEKFISECEKRCLRTVNKELLKKLKELDLINPIFTSKEGDFYDLYQLLEVSFIVKKCKLTDLEKEKVQILEELGPIKRILPLLQDIRYFYQPELYGQISSGVLPPDEFEIEPFQDVLRSYEKNLKSFKPTEYIKKHGFDKEEIKEIRDSIFIRAHWFDPMQDWYAFLRTIRTKDYSNYFKKIKGDVLLAHDYYIVAELLTFLYRDSFNDSILDPEDIIDGTGGKWKEGECANCGKKIKKINFRHRYCYECKINEKETRIDFHHCCKCNEVLLRYIDGNMVFEKISTHSKAKKGTLTKPIQISLEYGKMHIEVICADCDQINHIPLSSGWF